MSGKPPVVKVEWYDAWTKLDGVSLDDVKSYHAPTLVTTIGWLLYQDDTGVSLAPETYDELYRNRTFIPAGMIKSVTIVNLAKPRKAKPIKSNPESQ